MRKPKQRVIFSLFIFSICNGITMAADSSCGDWEPYKDEKCFKVFDIVVTEEGAKKICSQQENRGTLVTVHSKDEQDFLSNLLFKTHKVVDAVWIGAKYSSNKFKWTDDSDLSFTNWAEGSPSNTVNKACVQMVPEGSSIGKWADEPCNKNNKVVCQKMQNWSISRLQKTLLDARKELQDSLEDVRRQLKESREDRKQLNSSLENVRKNPVPIGFIYVQLSGKPEPKNIWPMVGWSDVSSNYAGLFFRAEGGGSTAFGQTQDENSPRLTQVDYRGQIESNGPMNITPGKWSQVIFSGTGGGISSCGLEFFVSSGEVRPRNQAVRIWERTN